MARARRGRAVTLLAALAVLGAVAWGVAALTRNAPPQITPHCTAAGYDLDPSQASVAAQMVGEVYRSGIEHRSRAAVLVLAAALQESKLSNIAPGEGDRDSVGVLQQRPSQDWGHIDGQVDTIAARTERLTDVTEATREFLVKLDTHDSWWTQPAATAIQDVQISADGSLYAQHEPVATAFAAALLGTRPAGITCAFDAPTEVATPAQVATALKHQLGLATPVTADHAVSVPGAGWQTAAWFVANADRYGIGIVQYAGREWTREHGWRTAAAATGEQVAATLAQPKS